MTTTTTTTTITTTNPPSPHSKPCTLCHSPRDVLVRCQIDATGRWHFVCPGACWRRVSGGVVDGDAPALRAGYRYGGMWKNRHEGVSAKMKKKKKKKGGKEGREGGKEGEGEGEGEVDVDVDVDEWVQCAGDGEGEGKRYTKNDRVRWRGRLWVCRKSHWGGDAQGTPEVDVGLWKEDDASMSVDD